MTDVSLEPVRKPSLWWRAFLCLLLLYPVTLILIAVMGLTVVVLAMFFPWVFPWVSGTRLEITITSHPDSAVVRVEPFDTTYRTSADLSLDFYPFRDADWIYLEAKFEWNHSRGRISARDGGLKSHLAIINKVQSMDGAAWMHYPADRQVTVAFPVADKFALTHQFWSARDFFLNGQRIPVPDGRDVQFLASGYHEVETESWSAHLDAESGFCIQFFERGNDDEERLCISTEPDQIRSGKLLLDEVSLDPFTSVPIRAARSCRLDLETKDGSKCGLSMTFKDARYPFLEVRVTYGS